MVDANTTIGVFCAVPVRCVAMPGVRCRQTALNQPTMSALGGVQWRKVACLPPLSAVVTRQCGGLSRPCGGSSTLSGGYHVLASGSGGISQNVIGVDQ